MPASQVAQAESEPAPAHEGLPDAHRLSLEEMSRIMDVAATLRKERSIVEQQLNIDEIKVALRQRLLETAKISGDPVTADEIDAAVDQYYERLHEFREPPPSVAKFLAHLWVLRWPLLKALAIVVALLAAAQIFS